MVVVVVMVMVMVVGTVRRDKEWALRWSNQGGGGVVGKHQFAKFHG